LVLKINNDTQKGISMQKNNEISVFIKSMRKKVRLTQKQLSERAGVGLRFIREMEQGKQSLQMDKVNQVLFLFGHKLGPVKIDIGNEND
jgi:y4mF family transcriptional regulator